MVISSLSSPPSSRPDTAVLTNAAFGSGSPDGGRHAWPLPPAVTADDRWLRAVALGGLGHYAGAHAELDVLLGGSDTARRLVSLSMSTKASLLRQLGWHARARGWDGAALAAAGGDADARVDALIGLAADALGLGRFGLARILLDRARPLIDHRGDQRAWRLPLRMAWVRAELAMVSGAGDESLRHARVAERMAQAVPSERHRVKTAMVLAAALSSSGQLTESARVARRALDAATAAGLLPLRWALAAMLAGLPRLPGDDGQRPEDLRAVRRECAMAIVRAGGRWRTEATD